MVGNFHLHLPHKKQAGVPKGCLAVKVGLAGEEQQRIVVPVVYFNHPLFMRLLKEAEDEYGFDQKGTITIPCDVAEFRYVQGLIDRESTNKSFHHHHHDDHHGEGEHQNHNHNHNPNPIVGCFKA